VAGRRGPLLAAEGLRKLGQRPRIKPWSDFRIALHIQPAARLSKKISNAGKCQFETTLSAARTLFMRKLGFEVLLGQSL